MTRLELRKLSPEERPMNYEQILQATTENRGHREVYEKPKTWTYWDSEIPRWYNAWKLEAAGDRKRPEGAMEE